MTTELHSKIQSLVSLPTFFVLLLLALGAWAFYHLCLNNLTADRHLLMQKHFRGLWTRLALTLLSFILHFLLLPYQELDSAVKDLFPYTGLLTILFGAALLISTFKVIASEYFFFSSMKEGVPILLVNVCSLILSLFILAWSLTSLFNVELSSILTTSAVFTIVLGLALQDTLGNLFAAISLQIDKPFEMGDWIEIKHGSDKIAGQVKELSWRATSLLAVTEELITLPNRTLAQCQIINYSGKQRPFYRGQFFRIPFSADMSVVKTALLDAAHSISDIQAYPEPLNIITETTESWITVKSVYAIKNYGQQFLIADRFYEKALELLAQRNIQLAGPRIFLEDTESLGGKIKSWQTLS